MVILVEGDPKAPFLIAITPTCISHSTNTLEKGMNLIILNPAMGK